MAHRICLKDKGLKRLLKAKKEARQGRTRSLEDIRRSLARRTESD